MGLQVAQVAYQLYEKHEFIDSEVVKKLAIEPIYGIHV